MQARGAGRGMTAAEDLLWWHWEQADGAGGLGQVRHVHSGMRIPPLGPVGPGRQASLGEDFRPGLRQGTTLHRFDCAHEDLGSPLVLSVAPGIWRQTLDHTASAAPRRRAGGMAGPGSGAFCRGDDAALEAFQFWPSARRQTNGQGRLVQHGGWHYRRWQSGLTRSTWTFSQDVVQWERQARCVGPVGPTLSELKPVAAVPERWRFETAQWKDPKRVDDARFPGAWRRFRSKVETARVDLTWDVEHDPRSARMHRCDPVAHGGEKEMPRCALQVHRALMFRFVFLKVADATTFLGGFDAAQPAWWDGYNRTRNHVENQRPNPVGDFAGSAGRATDHASPPLRGSRPGGGWRFGGWRKARHPEREMMPETPCCWSDPRSDDEDGLKQRLFPEFWPGTNPNAGFGDGKAPFTGRRQCEAVTTTPRASRLLLCDAAAARSRASSGVRRPATLADRLAPINAREDEADLPRAFHLPKLHWIGRFCPHLHSAAKEDPDTAQVFDLASVPPQSRHQAFRGNRMTI